jgi:hypothetical protein
VRPPDDKYDDVEFVAEGGMARVYRARRRDSGRVVAVREISGGPGSEDRIASERRGAEIQRALCGIDARVPKVFDIFTSAAGWLYVEMEYVDGEDLAVVMQRGPLPIADALRIGIALFDFLRVAHSTPVSVDGEQRNQQVHGDLTPRNIRIASTGAVRILDFGIAKGLKTTVTAVSFANYGYVSPERARSGQMGISDDFWSAGIVLYEMLSGERAFAGSHEEIAAALADRRTPPPLNDTVPRPMRLMVAKLLAWDPAYRYRDASAVLADFDAFLRHRPTQAEIEADASRTRAATRPGAAAEGKTTRPAAQAAHVRGNQATTPVRVPPLPKPGQPPGERKPLLTAAARRRRRWVAAAVGIGFVIVMVHERAVGSDVESRRRLAMTESGNLDSLWSDYQRLSDRAWLRSTTARLGRVLASRLVAEASTILKDYRQDVPRIRERQIEAARTQLVRALIVEPDDNLAAAWLRYAQGHLERIQGESQREDSRREFWARAVARFEEAARLAPDLPDPYLALTRLYTHRDYRDPDRARRAIAAAERRGHARGVREHAQLGDLARDEGDILFTQARDVRNTGSEEPLLARARAELVTALAEYELSKGYGQSSLRIKEITEALRRLDGRLSEIRAVSNEVMPPTLQFEAAQVAVPVDELPAAVEEASR